MNARSPNGTTATVISMWSAMLGGGMGATAGLFGGGLIISLSMGFISGFVCSVITVSLLLAVSYIVSSMLGTEFEDMPIGCPTTSQLSGVLGGIGGAVGAAVLAHYGLPRFQARTNLFAICWTVTGFLPIVMALVVVRVARYRAINPEGPEWLRPVLVRLAALWERYFPPGE